MKDISLPILTSQTAIFGFAYGIENSVYKITNHILLIFKLHVCKNSKRGTVELSTLINEIKKVKLLEKNQPKIMEGNWKSIILNGRKLTKQ